jgi:hypothetical protein
MMIGGAAMLAIVRPWRREPAEAKPARRPAPKRGSGKR